jgi:hypothetical protein
MPEYDPRPDVAKVLEYNWPQEFRDFEEQDEDGKENHIFTVLNRLDMWLKQSGYEN